MLHNPLDNLLPAARELIESAQAVHELVDYDKLTEEQQGQHDRLEFALRDMPASFGPEEVGYAGPLIRKLLEMMPAGEVDKLVLDCTYNSGNDPRTFEAGRNGSGGRSSSAELLDILAAKLDKRLRTSGERRAREATTKS